MTIVLTMLLRLTVVILSVAGSLSWLRRRKGVERVWREAADELGLSLESGATFSQSLRLRGHMDGLPIQVECFSRNLNLGISQLATRVAVDGTGRIPEGIVLCAEGTSVSFRDSLRRDRVLTQDEEFDARIHVWGEEARAVALFGPETRRRLLRAAEEMEINLDRGVLRCEIQTLADRADRLATLVRKVVDLVSGLTLADDMVPGRLAQNVVSPGSGSAARQRSLAVLQTHFPALEVTRATDRSLLRSENFYLRLSAAKHLASEGRETMRDLAKNEDIDPRIRDDARAYLEEADGSPRS